jgi:hypothetical protein
MTDKPRKRRWRRVGKAVIVTAAALVFLGSGFYLGSATEQRAAARLAAAYTASRHGDARSAARLARQGLHILPPWDRRWRAQCYLILAQAEILPPSAPDGRSKSTEWVRRALATDPRCVGAYLWQAVGSPRGSPAQKRAAERALALDDGTLREEDKAMLCDMLEKWPEVVKWGREALRKEPYLARFVGSDMARAYEKMGQPDKAAAMRRLAEDYDAFTVKFLRTLGFDV